MSWVALTADAIEQPTLLRYSAGVIEGDDTRAVAMRAPTRYVCLYRVSTGEQESSGLGIEAQRYSCRAFVAGEGGCIVREVVEIISGRASYRVGLDQVKRLCGEFGGTLLVHRLDRLSRTNTIIPELKALKIPLKIATHPECDEMLLVLYSFVAAQEARAISERTKAALKALRVRNGGRVHSGGVMHPAVQQLGTLSRRLAVRMRDRVYIAACVRYRDEGLSFKAIAERIMEDYPALGFVPRYRVRRWVLQGDAVTIETLRAEVDAARPPAMAAAARRGVRDMRKRAHAEQDKDGKVTNETRDRLQRALAKIK
jgi:DNA invertase Pin-like site-specific DNA recombinase